jgi:hypothetical protein
VTWKDYALLCAAAGGIGSCIGVIQRLGQWWEARKARKLKEEE